MKKLTKADYDAITARRREMTPFDRINLQNKIFDFVFKRTESFNTAYAEVNGSSYGCHEWNAVGVDMAYLFWAISADNASEYLVVDADFNKDDKLVGVISALVMLFLDNADTLPTALWDFVSICDTDGSHFNHNELIAVLKDDNVLHRA